MTDYLPAHPEAERFAEQNEVLSLYVKNTPIAKIARDRGITQREVRAHIQEWRDSAVGSDKLRDRVDELMVLMDEHFSELIQQGWKTLDEIDEAIANEGTPTAALLSSRTGAVKGIAELETKRVETLQKAGLLDAADMGEELLQMEEERDAVLKILSEVSFHCPNCKQEVTRRISLLTGQAVGFTDDGEEVHEAEVVG